MPGSGGQLKAIAACETAASEPGASDQKVTDGVNVAWSTYAFMTDRESYRRKLRLRLLGMLSCFADDAERYRRIVLVAHSLGTAVAADALAEGKVDGFRVPPLDFITLGSPLEFLALYGPDTQTSVERCLNAVCSWWDFYDLKDAFCSRVPLSDLLEQKFHARQISLGYSWLASLTGGAHSAYFDDPEVLTRILDPVPRSCGVDTCSDSR
jgi:hypothetical protein